jgi:thymidine phosphorylase
MLTLHTDEPERFERALAALDGGVEVAGEAAVRTPLVLERVARS